MDSNDSCNKSFDEYKRRKSLEIENLLGKDDWHLCEGFLTIFLKGNTRQTIVFHDDKSRSAHSASQHRSASQQRSASQHRLDTIGSRRLQKHMLDLGSCKETISLFESYNDRVRATYEDKLYVDKPSTMQSYHSPFIATHGDSISGHATSLKGNSLGSYANVLDT